MEKIKQKITSPTHSCPGMKGNDAINFATKGIT